jgi:mono/diheme cytochrome c family protein
MKIKIALFMLLSPLILLSNSLMELDKEEILYSIKKGKLLYIKTCISCHGDKGKAKTNMQLVVRPRDLTKSILTLNQIYKVIRDGSHEYGAKSDIMPSFKPVYSDEDIIDLSLYVFNTFTKQQEQHKRKLLESSSFVNKISLQYGKKVYNKNCSLCHGANGDGNSEYVRKSKNEKNFIYPYDLQRILLDENQIFLYTKYGGKYWGTDKDDMPSWKKKYDDYALKSVSKYINKMIKNK